MTFIPHPLNQKINITEDQADAFGRIRVSNPSGLLYVQHQYDEQPLVWDTRLTGNATITHDANNAAVNLNVTTTSGDEAEHRTIEYIRYQPGKSQLLFITFQMGVAETGLDQRVGYFDDADGIFLELTDSTVNFVNRSSASGSPVDTAVAQAAWNRDVMDGTGDSGITLDLTKSQILVIDLQWLGVGRVRVGFDVNGLVVYVHDFMWANAQTGVYMTTANLPLTYEIETTGVIGGAKVLKAICASASSEGGTDTDRGFAFSSDSTLGAGLISVAAGTEDPILALRTKAQFNSIDNHGAIILKDIEAFAEDQTCVCRVYYDPTISGGTWSSVNANSLVEINDNITSVSGGHCFNTFFVPASTATGNASISGTGGRGVSSLLPITRRIDGTLIPICITLENLSASAVDVAASIDWLELR